MSWGDPNRGQVAPSFPWEAETVGSFRAGLWVWAASALS